MIIIPIIPETFDLVKKLCDGVVPDLSRRHTSLVFQGGDYPFAQIISDDSVAQLDGNKVEITIKNFPN